MKNLILTPLVWNVLNKRALPNKIPISYKSDHTHYLPKVLPMCNPTMFSPATPASDRLGLPILNIPIPLFISFLSTTIKERSQVLLFSLLSLCFISLCFLLLHSFLCFSLAADRKTQECDQSFQLLLQAQINTNKLLHKATQTRHTWPDKRWIAGERRHISVRTH